MYLLYCTMFILFVAAMLVTNFWPHTVYVHIKKLSLRAAVVANRSITASMLGESDRWICSIIRHSKRLSSIEALSAV